jgi:uncharacterized RDD family membrane protein YckC/outer membrane protein assembly factor BamB
MYCKYCGIENENTAEFCQICERPFIAQETQQSQIVYLDYALFPFIDICKTTFKSSNLFNIIFFPILALIYFYHKLIRKPFWLPLRNSLQSQLKIVTVKNTSPAPGNSIQYCDNELQKLGFTYELTYTDIGSRVPHYLSLYINEASGTYAMQHIDKNTKKIQYTSFLAITDKRRVFVYSNTFGLPIEHEQIIQRYCKEKSISQLWSIFRTSVELSGERLLCPELKDIMPILFQLTIKEIEIATSINQLKIAASPVNNYSAWICHNHPHSIAVRKCPACGQALCEACINECDGTYYCKTCIPENVPVQEIRKPWAYAGLALRSVASSIDIITTLLFTAIIYGLIQFLLNHFSVVQSNLLALLITQIPLLATVYYNNVYRVAMTGQSVGKKLCGVVVRDKQGKTPGFVAAFNRLVIKLCSAIFVIPFFAYLFIPFTKKKKCFVDTLSGTIVLTKHSLKATILSLIIFLLFGAGAIGTIVMVYSSVLFPVSSTVTLEPVWEKKGKSYDLYSGFQARDYDTFFLYCLNDTVVSESKSTGTALWKTAFDSSAYIYYNDSTFIFVITGQYQNNARLHRLDKLNGTILWSTPLPDSGSCMILSDDSTIFVYGSKTIMSIHQDGTVRWKNSIPENTMAENASDSSEYDDEEDYDDEVPLNVRIDRVNSRIFMHLQKSNTSYSYDYLTGNRLQTSGSIESLPVRVNDSIYYTRHYDTLSFFSTVTHQKLFELQDSTYSIELPEENDTMLYCNTAAIAATNGDTIFTYADSFNLYSLADDYLLLGKADTSVSPLDNVQKYRQQHRVVDRFTNRILSTVTDTIFTSLRYKYQDDSLLYFFAMKSPWETGDYRKFSLLRILKNSLKSQQSGIITINKSDGAVNTIPIGSNIHSVQLFRSDNRLLLFTAGINVTGTYDLFSRPPSLK